MSTLRIYVPRDAAARSMGADETARAIVDEAARRALSVEAGPQRLARTACGSSPSSRWNPRERAYAYGPVAGSPGRRAVRRRVLRPASPGARKHALAHGPTEEMPYLKRQQRLTFARVGIIDPRIAR